MDVVEALELLKERFSGQVPEVLGASSDPKLVELANLLTESLQYVIDEAKK